LDETEERDKMKRELKMKCSFLLKLTVNNTAGPRLISTCFDSGALRRGAILLWTLAAGSKILGCVVTPQRGGAMYLVQLWVCIRIGPVKCSIDEEITGEKISVEKSSSVSICLNNGTLLAR
jgi:hypothetical protein